MSGLRPKWTLSECVIGRYTHRDAVVNLAEVGDYSQRNYSDEAGTLANDPLIATWLLLQVGPGRPSTNPLDRGKVILPRRGNREKRNLPMTKLAVY